MTTTLWTDGAVADLERIRAYLSAIDPAAARRLADRIAATAATLAVPDGTVTETAVTFPYLLRYQAKDDSIVIAAVRHACAARIV